MRRVIDRRLFEFLAVALAAAAALAPLPARTIDGAAPPALPPAAPSAQKQGRRYALLVGVTKYPTLPARRQLEGGANDAELLGSLLGRKFHFAADDVVVLKEGADAAKLPTHDNIMRELKALSDRAKPGDTVVVLFSGHGTRAPRQVKEGWFRNPDALTGLFLPRDVGQWNKQYQRVDNAIDDRTIADWSKPMLERGVAMWLIFDSCHSGGMAREAGRGIGEVARAIDPQELGIPQDIVEQYDRVPAPAQPAARGRSPVAKSALKLPTDSKLLTATYACPSDMETVERVFGDNHDKRYGLLTYAICQVLDQVRGELTYRDLNRLVRDKYVAYGRWRVSPVVEGQGADRVVLDTKVQRNPIRLSRSRDGKLMINAGRLLGLCAGSVLEVFGAPGKPNADRRIGYVRIDRAAPLSAQVTPVAYNYTPAPKADALPDGAICRPAFIDFGLEPLAVYATPEARKRFGDKLDKLDKDVRNLIQVKADRNHARWQVSVDKAGRVFLSELRLDERSAAEGPRGVERRIVGARFDVQLRPDGTRDNDPIRALESALRRVAQRRSFSAVVEAGQATRGFGKSLRVEVRLVRIKDIDDTKGQVLDPPTNGRLTQKHGDLFALQIINHSDVTVDVTLLFLGASYEIEQLFPRRGTFGDNRLRPGQRRRTDVLRVNADTGAGYEQVVVIAVPAQDEPTDFVFLTQPSLQKARSVDKTRGAGSFNSSLGLLFRAALYADRKGTRGVRREAIEEYGLAVLGWQTLPKPQP